MSGTKRSNRKFRSLKMESLENRELMAADVTASVSAGTLTVTGTDRAEFVRVNQVRDNITVSIGYSKPFASFAAADVQRLSMNMNAGNDKIEVNLQQRSLDSIFINLGRGSDERVDLGLGSVNFVDINADASLASLVVLNGTVNESAVIDFGNDASADTLRVNSSYVRRLDAKMGGGNDAINLFQSRVDRVAIDMGAGDDLFTNSGNSEVSSGTINGGSAVRGNRWTGPRFGKGVTVRGF